MLDPPLLTRGDEAGPRRVHNGSTPPDQTAMSTDSCPILDYRTPLFNVGRNLTVRRGTQWHNVAQARMQMAHGELSPPLPLQTEVRRFDTLTADDLQFEHDPGCRTPEGLLAELQRIYDGFSANEDVTLVHFSMD